MHFDKHKVITVLVLDAWLSLSTGDAGVSAAPCGAASAAAAPLDLPDAYCTACKLSKSIMPHKQAINIQNREIQLHLVGRALMALTSQARPCRNNQQ